MVGYGAPGKGNTLLNYCGVRTDLLDYTVDRNPASKRSSPRDAHPDPSARDYRRDASRPDPDPALESRPTSEQLAYTSEARSWSLRFQARPSLLRGRFPRCAGGEGRHFCGGLGVRMGEETQRIPKPMIPIGNRPILWEIMRYYASWGHNEFVLCLGYKGDVIREYFLNYNEALFNDFVRGSRCRRSCGAAQA